ncbi:MAG: methylthioribulose 1-phosphate dehydratase [Pyrinomonadaceae bacterium]
MPTLKSRQTDLTPKTQDRLHEQYVLEHLPFVDSFAQIASSLASISRGFHLRGWLLGTSGNLSAVVNREPLRVAMSPSGVDKGELASAQIVLIDEHAQVVSDHRAKPSDESPLHVRIVKERRAGAVLHTHSIWNTILSDLYAADGGVAIEGYEMLKGLEGVRTHEHREWLPIIENSQDMLALADNISDTLRKHTDAHGFLLQRHGLYSWGKDLDQAKRHVEILEFLLEALGRTHMIKGGNNDLQNQPK